MFLVSPSVQMFQLDLNNGNSSDDINAPLSGGSFNTSNTMTYRPNHSTKTTTIDFNANTFMATFGDNDGINGGPPATFAQVLNGDEIDCTISQL